MNAVAFRPHCRALQKGPAFPDFGENGDLSSPRSAANRQPFGTALRRSSPWRRAESFLDLLGLGTFGACCGPSERRRCQARRSEEHTSELQSRQYLVCRLLLEKKKNNSLMLRIHVS